MQTPLIALLVLCQTATAMSVVPDFPEPEPAIGFHLGQSYGTAVAHYPNGTVVKLAKVPASELYQTWYQLELLKRDANDQDRTFDPRLLPLRLRLQNLAGWSRLVPSGFELLADMTARLREASEAVLGAPLPGEVAFSLPQVPAWRDTEPWENGPVLKARIKGGVARLRRPVEVAEYLDESTAAMVGNEMRLCLDRYCYGEISTEDLWEDGHVLYVSATNASLYTAVQSLLCFHHYPRAELGGVHPEFGLRNVPRDADQAALFWGKLEHHLVKKLHDLAAGSSGDETSDYTILLGGEAAENAELQDAIRRAMERIRDDPAQHKKPKGSRPKVELLVSREPEYGPAMGAAAWRAMEEHEYCQEYAAETDYKPMGWGENVHDEL